MIFADRRPVALEPLGKNEAEALERYLQRRNAHKEEFVEAIVGGISDGPVLEANGGFGTLGAELLRRRRFALHCLCEAPFGQSLCERHLAGAGFVARCHPGSRRLDDLSLAPAAFELVYSVNCLHEWPHPDAAFTKLYELVRDGGVLVVNDLRRDADPYITEYVLREMAADQSAEGCFDLQMFLRSLQSAWSVAEVREVIESLGLGAYELKAGDAMTLTARIYKGARCPAASTIP